MCTCIPNRKHNNHNNQNENIIQHNSRPTTITQTLIHRQTHTTTHMHHTHTQHTHPHIHTHTPHPHTTTHTHHPTKTFTHILATGVAEVVEVGQAAVTPLPTNTRLTTTHPLVITLQTLRTWFKHKGMRQMKSTERSDRDRG